MNFEFQSAGKPNMNGLRGINAKAENPAAGHLKRNEKSAQFKNLLDQSQQDIKQADRQLEKVRDSQRQLKSLAESNRQGKEPTMTDDRKIKADDPQTPVSVVEELKSDESHEGVSLAALDCAQLMVAQNFQGGIETAFNQLNLKLGLAENQQQEGLTDQTAVIQLTDLNNPVENLPVLEGVTQFATALTEEVQVLPQNNGMLASEENEIEDLQGLLKNSDAEMAVKKERSNAVIPSQEMDRPVITDPGPESRQSEAVEQKLNNQTQQVKSETLVGGADLTEVQNSGKENAVDVQKNPTSQTETQNLDEKSVPELNVMAINSGKVSEVQPDTKVEVAQQVQQKILQNFEPNKPMVLQMTLSPDNLGDIDIKLSYDQGKLIIDITAISQETQNLLGKQINLLVRGLALQNVQVETVHLNTPVEQSSDSQDATFMMNSGSDPRENQNQTQLRERFIKNNGVLNSILTSGDEDESVMIPQNLQNYTNHTINYLI